MLEIQTKAYGPMTIDERQIFTIPEGLYGFEEFQRFALIDAHQKPFYWLQSLEDPNLAFILIKPSVFRTHYEPGIELSDLASIGVKAWHETVVFALVTIPSNGSFITANLQGPLYLSKSSNLGKQCISPRDEYRTKHNVLEEMAALQRGGR